MVLHLETLDAQPSSKTTLLALGTPALGLLILTTGDRGNPEMHVRRCTIDSSCIIALDHLNLAPQLSFLFPIVLVPKAVRAGLFKRRATKDRLQALFEDFSFLQRCDGYEQGTVSFLLAERLREGAQDRGEVEAVVQASQFGAALRSCFESLRKRGIRLPWKAVNALLTEIGQDWA